MAGSRSNSASLRLSDDVSEGSESMSWSRSDSSSTLECTKTIVRNTFLELDEDEGRRPMRTAGTSQWRPLQQGSTPELGIHVVG